MNAVYLKFLAAALLFLLWTALVWTGHADPALIGAIKFALGSLGLYHTVTNLQGTSQLAALLQALQQPSAPAAPPKSSVPTIAPKEMS